MALFNVGGGERVRREMGVFSVYVHVKDTAMKAIV